MPVLLPFDVSPIHEKPHACYRFSLQTRRGGLVKIYDSALMSGVRKLLLDTSSAPVLARPSEITH